MRRYKPHQQLKTIRKTLHKTQKQLAEMLGVSYPYLLSVETGQRDISEPLARKITAFFGIRSNIRDKQAEPRTWDRSSKKLVRFSAETLQQHNSQLPTFLLPPDMTERVTPTLADYGKAFHVALHSAQGAQRLGAALQGFFVWFAEHFSGDWATQAFLVSAEELYPDDQGVDAARRALLGYIYDIHEGKLSPSHPKRKRKRKR